MRVLLTGAFGNVGVSTLEALLAKGYEVRCFDVPTKMNRKTAAHYTKRAEIFWGDLRNIEDVRAAVDHCPAVIHLAFVIPHLSVTGVNSEDQPEFARSVNVGGTRNLIEAMQEQSTPARLIFASSLHVYGKTQHLPPPRSVRETPHPVEHYAHHKLEAEQMVRESGLDWTILRLGAALPVRLILDPGMFNVPLENRIEFIHTRDAGIAFANAVEAQEVLCKTLHVAGGPRCQVYYRGMMGQVLDAMGIGALPDRAFTREPFSTDWLDTTESQALLRYQSRTFEDYTKDLRKSLGLLRPFIIAFQPLVRRWLLSKSPFITGQVSRL